MGFNTNAAKACFIVGLVMCLTGNLMGFAFCILAMLLDE